MIEVIYTKGIQCVYTVPVLTSFLPLGRVRVRVSLWEPAI